MLSDRRALFSAGFDRMDLLRALRPHQWAKNTLLFVPALAAHAFTLAVLPRLGLAFVAFGAVASAGYLINDLCDVASDRAHPTKRFRPIASGRIPARLAAGLSGALMLAGLVTALMLAPVFATILVGYAVLTLAYSLFLKKKAIVDVMALAALYTVRMFAGAAVIGVAMSEWLVAFSMFFFLSLALVKRATEMPPAAAMPADPERRIPGRGYYPGDAELIRSLAATSGIAAVVIFALYISSPAVQALYSQPQALWLICLLLFYWLARMQLLVHRGLMHDDPVVFALRDQNSGLVLAASVAVLVASSY